MTHTLHALLAMWKKNNTQPGMLSTLWVVAAMASFGVYDAARTLPPPAWLGMFLWVLILGTSAGAGAFSSDLKLNHMRFLEYLPIRRWHIWLADWGDGVLWLLLMVALLTLPRTLSWTPPELAATSPEDRFALLFFPTRGSVLIGLSCLAVAAFSIGAFYRVLVERDSAAIFRSITSSLAVCSVVWVVPVALRLFPTLLESAVPLFLIGALFSAGSFVVFVFDRKHWGFLRRWGVLRLPCWLVIHALVVVVMYAHCVRWSALDPAAPSRVYGEPVSGASGRELLVSVDQTRSGPHLLRLDPRTGRQEYLGRGVMPYGRGNGRDPLAGDRLVLTASFAANGLWPARDALVTVNRDGTGRRTLLPSRREYEDGGRKYVVHDVAWTADGTTFVFAGLPIGDADGVVFVIDATGAVRHRVPADAGTRFALHGDRAVMLARRDRDPVTHERPPPRTLLEVDLRSGRRRKVDLPGVLIGCSADLAGAACLAVREDRGVQRRSILWVDLQTLASRVVAGEDEVPAVALEDVPRYFSSSVEIGGVADTSHAQAGLGGGMYFNDVHVVLDGPSPRRVVWFTLRKDHRLAPPGLTVVDLASGARRTLLGDAEVRTRPTTRPQDRGRQTFHVYGFSRGGDWLIYGLQEELVSVATDDPGADRVVMARRPDGFDSVYFELSPDRRRVVASSSQFDQTGPKPSVRHLVEVWGDDRPVKVHYGAEPIRAFWLDDKQLILQDHFDVSLVNADGTGRRLIFQTGRKRKDGEAVTQPN